MAQENNNPKADLKEFQDHIAKELGIAALARIDASADRILAPHMKDDIGKVFLAYLALKATVAVVEE